MKSYTDIEQSKKLAEILPIESADCYWDYDEMQKFHRISWFEDGYNKESQLMLNENNVCAWSLAALIDVLPDESDIVKGKLDVVDYKYMCTVCIKEEVITVFGNNLLDTCYEMIIKLYKRKLL